MKNKALKITALVLAFVLVIGSGSLLAIAIKNRLEKINLEEALIAERSVDKIKDVFHDQGYIYMSPTEPSIKDTVTIRLSTLKYNVTRAQLVYTTDEGQTFNKVDMEYDGISEGEYYDLWKAKIPPQGQKYRYFFLIGNESNKDEQFYSVKGVTGYQPSTDLMFTVDPGFTTPDWSKGTYWYAMNIGSFYNGDSTNDAFGYIDDLSPNQDVRGSNYRSFYGGDLKGAMEKIEYIKSLGVKAVYLNPLWPSFNTTGYGTTDYYLTNPQFGTEQDLMDFVALCHKNDIKVMLDAVASYNTDMGNWYNSYEIFPLTGASQSINSAFKDIFKFYEYPNVIQKVFSSFTTDFSSEITKKMYYTTKDSLLTRYLDNETYNIDGWRFDAQDFLWGSGGLTYQEIGKDMKKYIKAYGNDILYLGEIYTEDIAEEGIWESLWNNNQCSNFRKLMTGDVLSFRDTSYIKVHTHPRPLAESMYTYIDGHDWDRVSSIAKNQYQIDSGMLALMTYTGSPAVWYGDDTGSETVNGRMDGFNWDESTWKYDNYYLHLALAQLRNDYASTMQHGVIKWGDIDNQKKFGTYVRFDENAACVVALNVKGATDTREIDVSVFDIKDGTILTDYLTGKKYEVKDGKINADVIAGGTVFVTGNKISDYRDRYKVVSDSKNKNNVEFAVLPKTFTNIKVEGKAILDNKKDSGTFAQTPVFEGFKLSAQVNVEKKSSAAITVTDNESVGDSLRYSAIFDGENLKVYARTKKGEKANLVCDNKVDNGSVISIVRNQNNEFSVEVENNGKTTTVKNSSVYIPMKQKVYAGFVSLKGSAVFSKVALVETKTSQNAETFESNSANAKFILEGKADIKNGVLSATKKNNAEYSAIMPLDDFTVKTVIKSGADVSEKGYAGIYAGNLDTDAVFVGIVGKKLVFARIINGQMAVYADTDANADITVQLQKTGNLFSVVYKEGSGAWQQLGTKLLSAYSSGKVGIAAKNAKASFDYITFGDALNGGGQLNTPVTIKDYLADDNYLINGTIRGYRSWKIDGNKSNWDYVVGGIAQKLAIGNHTMYENNVLTDFRAEGTIVLGEGSGFAGMFIRGNGKNFAEKNGYVIKLNDSGELSLCKNGVVIDSVKIDNIPKTGLRVVVEAVDDKILVFAGNPLKLVFNVSNVTQKEGYFGYYTSNKAVTFTNYALYRLDVNFAERGNSYMGTQWSYSAGYISVTAGETEFVSLSRKGTGYTDAAAFVQISAEENVKDTEEKQVSSYAGLAFAGDEGIRLDNKGIFFGVSTDGKIAVFEGGEKKAEADIKNYNEKVNNLLVTVKDGVYTAYVNNTSVVAITFVSDNKNGGTVSLAANNAKVKFSHFYTEDLSGADNINNSQIKNKASRYMGNTEFVENVKGTAYYMAKVNHRAGKATTTTVPTGNYSDFVAQFTMKLDNANSGNAGLTFAGGYKVTVSTTGTVSISAPSSGSVKTISKISEIVDFFSTDDIPALKLKLVKSGDNVKLYIGGDLALEAEIKSAEGEVGLYSSNAKTEFTAFTITP